MSFILLSIASNIGLAQSVPPIGIWSIFCCTLSRRSVRSTGISTSLWLNPATEMPHFSIVSRAWLQQKHFRSELHKKSYIKNIRMHYKAALLQIHPYFHENFENVFKSKIVSSEQKK
jgi:hypothetical protein